MMSVIRDMTCYINWDCKGEDYALDLTDEQLAAHSDRMPDFARIQISRQTVE